MATDPVCGMWVDERPSSLHLVRATRTYYFCSESCLRQFVEPAQQLRNLRARLAVGWPLAVAVVAITYLGRGEAIDAAAALAAVVQFYVGAPFYRGVRDAVVDRSWNMDVLIAVGTSAAFLYSVAVLVFPARLPHAYYFDASTLIVTLILTGNYLEYRTRDRAGFALRRLEELLPETASVVRDGREESVPATEIRLGDRVRVRPGERFPVDGTLLDGRTSVDESLLTGESSGRSRVPGDPVVAGALNGDGLVELRATGVGTDTFVAEVGRLLTDAEMARVPLRRAADRLAAVFVPVVLSLGIVAGTLWWRFGGADPTVALLVFVTVVITACPCAFGIATPAAVTVGTGRAAESGVLFRGEDALERAATVDTVLADKTGTLTTGRPTLTEVRAREGIPSDHVLTVAAAVESGVSHPLARAVASAALARGLHPQVASDVVVEPGRGVRGRVEGHEVEVVRAPERDPGVDGAFGGELARFRDDGVSSVLVRENDTPVGLLAFRDEIAPGAVEAVRALAQGGIGVVMVTGDQPAPAGRVAATLGIADVRAGVSPAGKLDVIRSFQAQGRRVAFVGDGVNDAPALAGADVGIAIGTGTAVAREAGQVLLVRPDVRGVPFALSIARATVRKVRGNLGWAVGYNAVLLPIAMGALVPLLGFRVYSVLPIVGAAAMAVSSTIVVANSLSLRRAALLASPQEARPRANPSH